MPGRQATGTLETAGTTLKTVNHDEVMLDWWSSHILYHRIVRVEGMPPERFIDAPLDLFQCVYELRITAFESEAWRKNVSENPSPDIHAYLKAQLNIDV